MANNVNNFQGVNDSGLADFVTDVGFEPLGQSLFGEPETVGDVMNLISPSGALSSLTGVGAAEAAASGQAAQEEFARRALGTLISDLAPFKALGTSQIGSALSLATDPAAQREQMLNNPSLELQRGLASSLLLDNPAAAGRVGTIGGQDALRQSFLNMQDTLTDQQLNRQIPLLQFGQASAAQTGTGASDLLEGIGASQAAATIGAANAQQQGAGNALSAVGTAFSLFSDPQLKDNIKMIGTYGDIGVFVWDWNEKAAKLGIEGRGCGHMATEVERVYPELITEKEGYMQVIYGVPGKTVRVK